MSCELTVVDRFGRTVRLDHSNWEKHKPRHPEVVPYHDDLPVVLVDPDLVVELPDGTWHYYRRGHQRARLAACYLRLVVEYFDPGGWKIKIAHPATAVRPMGTMQWIRTQPKP
jgi:hypothetical protein